MCCQLQVGVKGSEYDVGIVKGQRGLFSAACEVVDSATGSGRGGSTGGVSSAAIVRER